MFGCSDRIAVGRIHDNDAALGCRRDIDIVDPDAGAADDLEIVRRVEQLGGDLCRRAHREPLIARQAALQFGRAEPGRNIGLDAARGQDLNGARAQLIGDQYLRHSKLRKRTH